MLLSFGLVLDAILLALGIYWCYEVFGRWRSDLQDLREVEDTTRKAVIIGIWAVTVVIAALVVNFVIGLVGSIISGIQDLV